jgi:hypothetical protein
MLGAAPGAFAQSGYAGYPPQAYPQPDQGSQAYQPPSQSDQPPPQPPQDQGYPSRGPNGQGYAGPGYQNQGGSAQAYDQSQDSYQEQLRQYRREKREYDRQRRAYDEQFGGGAPAGGYAPPPPPQAPAPPLAWRGDGDGGRSGGFYRYSETMPFHDGPWNGGARDADWYHDHGCRLATPREGASSEPGQSVPVCPDGSGRYRPVG